MNQPVAAGGVINPKAIPAANVVPNVVQNAAIANKNSDSVTLETDDGFYNIKATGDPSAVSRVF